MLIDLIALAVAWLVLNAGLLAAVALAHRSGRRKAAEGPVASRRPAPVGVLDGGR